jgi:hypothetical protein
MKANPFSGESVRVMTREVVFVTDTKDEARDDVWGRLYLDRDECDWYTIHGVGDDIVVRTYLMPGAKAARYIQMVKETVEMKNEG